MEDQRNILRDEQPFSYRILKNDKAQVFWKGRMIKMMTEKEVKKLIRVADGGDEYAVQLFLAKITGHFKHGNERAKK